VTRQRSNTNVARQRRKRAKLAARGWKQCNIWVPSIVHAEFHLMAELIRENPRLVPGALRDTCPGNLSHCAGFGVVMAEPPLLIRQGEAQLGWLKQQLSAESPSEEPTDG
jgi:hypothetical protein